MKIFVAGFDRVLLTLSFDKFRIPSEIEGLKASPEWRPEKAVVEVPRQARDLEATRRVPWAECSCSQQGFINNPGQAEPAFSQRPNLPSG